MRFALVLAGRDRRCRAYRDEHRDRQGRSRREHGDGQEPIAGSARLYEATGREITIRELRRELEPIARGREPGYSHDERKAAFDLLNHTERLRPDERIVVRADLHLTLSDTHEVKERIREVSERQRVLKREHSRGTERERALRLLNRHSLFHWVKRP